jgi:hypothetical protein
MHPVHFFALLEQHSFRPYCDEWHEGDTWTTLAQQVNCPKCALLLSQMDYNAAVNTDRVEPATEPT